LRVWKRREEKRRGKAMGIPFPLGFFGGASQSVWAPRGPSEWQALDLTSRFLSICSWDKVILFCCHPPCMHLESYVTYIIEVCLFHLYMCQNVVSM
jgi:hypothetical protein